MEGSQIIFNNMHLPFLIYFLLLIPSLNSEFSADFIGDLNHYSIAYNSKLASDQQQLDAIFEEAPERIVSLKTADLEDYTCILPVAENKVCLNIALASEINSQVFRGKRKLMNIRDQHLLNY